MAHTPRHSGPLDVTAEGEKPTRTTPGVWCLLREMDPTEQLDVDLTILDYIMYKTMDHLFTRRELELYERDTTDEASHCLTHLQMVNSFIAFMQHRHPADKLPDWYPYRTLLLQLTVLFTLRPTRPSQDQASPLSSLDLSTPPSIHSLRTHFQSRLTPAQHASAVHLLSTLPLPADAPPAEPSSPPAPTLSDLLPLFLHLTTLRAKQDTWSTSPRWLEMAGEWMTWATIELLEEHPPPPNLHANLTSIWAWGCDPSEDPNEPTTTTTSTSPTNKQPTLFTTLTPPYPLLPTWDPIRARWLAVLGEALAEPPREAPPKLSAGLASLADRLSGARATLLPPQELFEKAVLGFLWALWREMPTPDLVQVERGRVEGVGTEEESRRWLGRMGVGR